MVVALAGLLVVASVTAAPEEYLAEGATLPPEPQCPEGSTSPGVFTDWYRRALQLNADLFVREYGRLPAEDELRPLLPEQIEANLSTLCNCLSSHDDDGCVASGTTLCLNNDRFKVEVAWQTSTGMGLGQVVPDGTGDSSIFWFFSPNNWEMLFKVLDGCVINGHFWVLFAATTDVGFTATVTDTQEDEVKVYTNQLGHAANAVVDTSAFATCP